MNVSYWFLMVCLLKEKSRQAGFFPHMFIVVSPTTVNEISESSSVSVPISGEKKDVFSAC